MSTLPTHPARLLQRSLLGVALVFLTAFGVAGCSVVGALIPSDATAVATPTAGAGGDTDVSGLAVGDCVDAVDGDISAGLDAVPCADPHDWEVYYEITVATPADAGPGATVAAAEEGCGSAFWPFLGLSAVATSALGYTYLVPDDSTESPSGGLVVRCLIGDMNGPVSGSLAGAAR